MHGSVRSPRLNDMSLAVGPELKETDKTINVVAACPAHLFMKRGINKII